MIGRRKLVYAAVVAVLAATACDRPQAKDSGDANASTLAAARATVAQRYAEHWRSGQGFSADTLRAREQWFTPALYQLMRADMSGSEIGIVDYDPFTEAQDDAERYAVGAARASHDTVYVPVDVRFASSSGSHRAITLAMVRDAAQWKIADFIDHDGSLVAKLRANAPK